MMITHTQNAKGETRIYIGGKSSIECYITPNSDGRSWSFHMDEAVAGMPLTLEQQRKTCAYLLVQLADMLNVAQADLKDVPFETLVALHTSNPLESRRVAMPRKKTIENGYMATQPNVTRPKADFHKEDYENRRERFA